MRLFIQIIHTHTRGRLAGAGRKPPKKIKREKKKELPCAAEEGNAAAVTAAQCRWPITCTREVICMTFMHSMLFARVWPDGFRAKRQFFTIKADIASDGRPRPRRWRRRCGGLLHSSLPCAIPAYSYCYNACLNVFRPKTGILNNIAGTSYGSQAVTRGTYTFVQRGYVNRPPSDAFPVNISTHPTC